MQAVGDFDGDGLIDLFWRDRKTGENFYWRDGYSELKTSLLPVPDLAWNVVAAGDYDGDGRTDLFWRHRVRGDASMWPAANGRQVRSLARVSTDWFVAP